MGPRNKNGAPGPPEKKKTGGPWAPKIIFGALGPPLGPWGASRPMGPGPRASRPMGLKDPGPQGRWGPWGGPWGGQGRARNTSENVAAFWFLSWLVEEKNELEQKKACSGRSNFLE